MTFSTKNDKSQESHRYLVFHIQNEKFGIPLMKVKEVVAPMTVTPIPGATDHFTGVINLRGQIISIVDLKKKLGVVGNAKPAEPAVVILDLADHALGVTVDAIESVVEPTADEMRPAPDMSQSQTRAHVDGLICRSSSEIILLLNIEKSLSIEDLERIQKTKGLAA